MKTAWLCLSLIFVAHNLIFSQNHKSEKENCKAPCGVVGDEMQNTTTLYQSRSNVKDVLEDSTKKLKFPLRFLYVSDHLESQQTYTEIAMACVAKLNTGFEHTNMEFFVDRVESLHSIIKIEDLHVNGYALYNEFSLANDIENTISVYVFDYETNLCVTTPTSISCGRTSGFSYILSNLTSNVVLSKFDLEDDKILTHEMGHFFGLYHTFEESMFGKDNFVEDCRKVGDCICDTPPDPGSVFEVYVNYSKCAMSGYYHENGNEYLPLVDNYMAYYKPCYMRTYAFTKGQIELLNLSAKSPIRSKFSR